MFKRLGALVMSVMMLGSSMAAAAAADVNLEGYPSQKGYDPETVMWTDNPIENVLAETGIYGNAAEVNPNADSKSNVSMQNPYAANGDKFTGWAYSEFCWTNSYPIGNGRMAGMVAGGIDKEVIQINEDTCWDGSPYGTLKDENGNICGHAHEHEHMHTHTYEHNHVHSHEHGHEDDHHHEHTQTGEAVHCHGSEGHCHSHEGHCHGQEGHCHSHESQAAPANQNEALLQYMLDHNTHHAAELDQMAQKLAADGHANAAEQIRKAVDEFQKGNLYLSLALSLVKE